MTDLNRDGHPSQQPFPTFELKHRFGGLITAPAPEPTRTDPIFHGPAQEGPTPAITAQPSDTSKSNSPASQGKSRTPAPEGRYIDRPYANISRRGHHTNAESKRI